MDANQRTLANPFGMDEGCTNCPALAGERERVVHGYGAVDADFLFVGEAPDAGAEETGIPFGRGERGRALRSVLDELGLRNAASDADAGPGRDPDEPDLGNVYVTYLSRCRHPDRPPSEEEVANCDPFLTAEIRTINPEVLVPVGERALRALAAEYTTTRPGAFAIEADHAAEIRGRGFEIVPTVDPGAWTAADRAAFVETMADIVDRDYRVTKGRRGKETRRMEDRNG